MVNNIKEKEDWRVILYKYGQNKWYIEIRHRESSETYNSYEGCKYVEGLGEVDINELTVSRFQPCSIDLLIAIQRYNPWSRRIKPTCVTKLIDKYKISDKTFDSSFLCPIGLTMASLIDFVYPEIFKNVNIITYVPAHQKELRRDVRTHKNKNPIELLARLVKDSSEILKNKELLPLLIKLKPEKLKIRVLKSV
ncbi:hypothetical protein DRJ17_05455 [Candidatus Woesearchaeota archaeon]|nr:MAG: hypothetical protein DRJ17_05455 [Candidatus Woesearchaeota archaeon]